MKTEVKYIFTFIFAATGSLLPLKAQLASDTILHPGILLGVDIGSLGLGLARVSSLRAEAALELRHKAWYYVAEAGWASSTQQPQTFQYQHTALFLRLGMQKNLLKGDDAFFVGGRYCISQQQYRYPDITLFDPFWGNYTDPGTESRNFLFQWIEGNVGVKSRLWGRLTAGFTIRARFKMSSTAPSDPAPLEVLAFGKTDKGFQVGMSYTLYYLIPFRSSHSLTPSRHP
jgi:hypothetical protein